MRYLNLCKVYLTVLFFILSGNINAQISLDSKINNIIENLKLDTDRDIYINGEKIYYSIDYFINNMQVLPILSNIVYVELINCADNTPIIQKKIKFYDYKANDILKIPKNISSGNYVIRAYTQYQRNFSEKSFAYHFITILNPNNSPSPLIYNMKNDSIEIVPEGNVLLEGIITKFCFRVPERLLNKSNKYFIATNENWLEVKMSKDGFAQKDLMVDKNMGYELKVLKKNGDTISIPFPRINNNGIVTTINRIDKNIIYKVSLKRADIKDPNYKVQIISNDYNINYSEEFEIKDNKSSLILSKDFFNIGINYIVLFNSNNEIKKINSIFISPNKIRNFDITLEKDIFNTNEIVTSNFLITNNNEQVKNAIVSVSLRGTKKTNYSFIPELYFSNPILLEDYLFNLEENNDSLYQELMVLFDRRIDKDIFKKQINNIRANKLKHVPDVKDVTIKGVLRNKKTKEPVYNNDIFVSVLFNNPQLHVYKTKKDGRFIFSLNNVKDINDIYICANPSENSQDYEIVTDNLFSLKIPSFGKLPTFISDTDKQLIKKIYINSQIQNHIRIDSIVNKHKRIKTDQFNINYNKKTTYVEDYIKLKNIEEFFFEVVPNVKYRKVNGKYKFTIYNEKGWELPGRPLVLIDKIPIFDFNKIKQLNISNVEKVEVINQKYYLGVHTFQGVIMITTKTDNFAGIKFPEVGVFIEYNTIEQENKEKIIRDFNLSLKEIPDFKTILYWNPALEFSKGKAKINFKTSYSKGIYDIKIKAYNSKGDVIYGKKQITIK